MVSDVIHVASDGTGMEEALATADKVAAYQSLDKKSAVHLRLFAEEMMGMMKALTGEREADFRIEVKDGVDSLHLTAETMMNAEMREKLISASTAGENAAAKGFAGKLKDIFQRAFEPQFYGGEDLVGTGFVGTSAEISGGSLSTAGMWSLNRYKNSVASERPDKDWDELERSLVAELADEVEVGISGNTVELVVYKKF